MNTKNIYMNTHKKAQFKKDIRRHIHWQICNKQANLLRSRGTSINWLSSLPAAPDPSVAPSISELMTVASGWDVSCATSALVLEALDGVREWEPCVGLLVFFILSAMLCNTQAYVYAYRCTHRHLHTEQIF